MDAEVDRLRKKVENFPSPSSYNRLAELLVENDRADDAIAICQRSIRDFPRNGQAYVIHARVLRARGQADQAQAQLEKAIEQDPRLQPARLELADLHQQSGRPEEAARQLKAVLEHKPDDEVARKRLAGLGSGANRAVAAAKPHQGDSVVDLRGVPTGLTSIVANRSRTGTAAHNRTAAPAAAPARAKQPSDILASYCSQPEVRCALIADHRGRCIAARSLPPGLDDLVAALADEITRMSSDCLKASGAGATTNWTITAEKGQILSFNEHSEFSLIAIANPGIKVAMLELRARQAMLDLGSSL